MKRIVTALLLIICSGAFAQDSLKVFNYNRVNTTKTGMEVLGSWGVANIGIGIAGLSNSKGGANRSFYKMTTIWGATNVVAAVLGALQNDQDLSANGPGTLAAQRKIESTFLINGCVDVAYLGVGIYLKQRGDHKNFADLKGDGSAIIVQSIFLLIFDGTMRTTHRHNGNKLRRFLEKNPIGFTGKSVGINFNM
jgi:hypothetical protein